MRANLNRIFVLLLLMVTGFVTGAQQKVYTISVGQAVEIAFQNVEAIKNARLDHRITAARNNEITGMAYPQVSADLQGNHYLKLPLIQFPDATEDAIYKVLQREGVKDANGQPIDPDNAEFNVNNFSFQAPWNFSGGLTVSQLLFEPQVFVGLQARKTLLESSEINIKVEEDRIRQGVYNSYYAVLIGEKQLSFVQESIKRLEKLASDMEVMFKNGFAEKLDIDKTTVTLNNTKSVENQLKNGIAVGYAALKATMGLHQLDSIILTDKLEDYNIKDGLLEDDFSYENRNEIKLLHKAIDLQKYDIKRYKLSYFPTVSMFFNYNRTGQRNANFESFTNKPWFWYNTSIIGLNVNVPIFDGFQKKNKIKQSQYNLEKVMNTLDNAKRGIDLERTAARNTLTNALLTLDVQEKNMELAGKVYTTVKKKYEQGLGSSFEVLQADTDMQQAQSNYFRSLYDAIIARIGYLKALGKL